MKKINRILKNSDFKEVIKNGAKIYSSLFSIYFINNTEGTYKIGISVSKKVSKIAVKRNLIKRRIVAAINELKLPANINKNIVIIAKNTILEKHYNDIRDEIFKIFKLIRKKGGVNVQ